MNDGPRLPVSYPNPELSVGPDNKQGWNQPAERRFGFHNAHLLFRRALMMRSRRVLRLDHAPSTATARAVAESGLVRDPAFSALVVAETDRVLFAATAPDFTLHRPHSIQSVTKLHVHLLFGELFAAGRAGPHDLVGSHLPWIGPAYAGARIADVLDMNVENDFSEDYDDPLADCYREEEALGWRLPPDGRPEITLRAFLAGLRADRTAGDLVNRTGCARYKSANTDVLTVLAATLLDGPISDRLQAIVDAAGYEGAFHVSLSPDGFPALSGGGCLSACDLARFGLLLARGGAGVDDGQVGSAAFTHEALARPAPAMLPPREHQRYSSHLMTDGRRFGHAGYGGQYLMVDPATGRVAAFLSVLENESGYDAVYMRHVVDALGAILDAG